VVQWNECSYGTPRLYKFEKYFEKVLTNYRKNVTIRLQIYRGGLFMAEATSKKPTAKKAATAKKPSVTKPVAPKKATKQLTYRGHPVMRKDSLIYYGSMGEKYIIMMQVLDSEPVKDLQVAKRVSVELQRTDPNLKSKDRVVRKSEKRGMYAALDIASIWLDRALSGKM